MSEPQLMIKVCGITRREDAEVAVELGATALGFIFYPRSPRYVTAEQAARLGDRLPAWRVGVFVDENPPVIEQIMRAAKLQIAQIYGGSAPAGTRVWKAFRVAESFDATLGSGADAVLLDGSHAGVSFDWQIARAAVDASPAKVIIAGGLDGENVADAIRMAHPWGVDASSRLESSPGVKDHAKVRRFIKAAQEAS